MSKPSYSSHNGKIAAALSLEHEVQFTATAALLLRDAFLFEIVDIHVTCDATWSRWGHQAKYGAVVSSWKNGLVLDTKVLRKFCKECHAKKTVGTASDEFLNCWEEFQGNCGQNYYGSSGGIEAREEGKCGSGL